MLQTLYNHVNLGCEMAWLGKQLPHKPGNLSSSPGMYRQKRINYCKLFSDIYTHAVAGSPPPNHYTHSHMYTYIHTLRVIIIINFKSM